MNDQQPSSTAYRDAMVATTQKQEAAPKTVADLLNDAKAMADWKSNIEKLRQKEPQAQSGSS